MEAIWNRNLESTRNFFRGGSMGWGGGGLRMVFNGIPYNSFITACSSCIVYLILEMIVILKFSAKPERCRSY